MRVTLIVIATPSAFQAMPRTAQWQSALKAYELFFCAFAPPTLCVAIGICFAADVVWSSSSSSHLLLQRGVLSISE